MPSNNALIHSRALLLYDSLTSAHLFRKDLRTGSVGGKERKTESYGWLALVHMMREVKRESIPDRHTKLNAELKELMFYRMREVPPPLVSQDDRNQTD